MLQNNTYLYYVNKYHSNSYSITIKTIYYVYIGVSSQIALEKKRKSICVLAITLHRFGVVHYHHHSTVHQCKFRYTKMHSHHIPHALYFTTTVTASTLFSFFFLFLALECINDTLQNKRRKSDVMLSMFDLKIKHVQRLPL